MWRADWFVVTVSEAVAYSKLDETTELWILPESAFECKVAFMVCIKVWKIILLPYFESLLPLCFSLFHSLNT